MTLGKYSPLNRLASSDPPPSDSGNTPVVSTDISGNKALLNMTMELIGIVANSDPSPTESL
jgi:hypothetical protein